MAAALAFLTQLFTVLGPVLAKLGLVLINWLDKQNEIRVKKEKDAETQEKQIEDQEKNLETDKKLQEFRKGLNWFVHDHILTQKQKEKRAKKQAKKI